MYMSDESESDTSDSRSDSASILSSPAESCDTCLYNGKSYLTNECPNSIPTKAPKLEEMASVSVAIGLWNQFTRSSPKFLKDEKCGQWSLRSQVSEETDELPLPKSFKEDIDYYIRRLVDHVSVWVSYHHGKIFQNTYENRYKYHYGYRFVDCIVWYPNGAINYYKTALNLLKSDALSGLEKYRLACTYCLKEEIKKRRMRLISKNKKAEVKAEFPAKEDSNVLFCYWNCYFAEKLDMVPVPEDLTIDEFMFLHKYVDNWTVIEYFFDRLTEERQVACVIRFIEGTNHQYQEPILLKLNDSQRTQIYAQKPTRIIQNYLSNLAGVGAHDSELKAISIWYEVRDMITSSQFIGLMNRLVRDSPPVSNDFLMEIWKSSYDELKLALLNHDRYDFIGDVFRWACEKLRRARYGCDFFFTALEEDAKLGIIPLAEWSFVQDKFFYRWCAEMIASGEIELFTRVINLCLPEARDCALVKRRLKETRRNKIFETESNCVNVGCRTLISKYEFSKLVQLLNFFYLNDDQESRKIVCDMLLKYLKYVDSYCLDFYLDGKVGELNEKLAPLILSYPEIVLTYKKYLLFSIRGIKACYSHFDSTSNALTEIISDGLPDERDVIKFGKKLIFSDEGVRILHKLLRDKNFPNDVVKRNIDLLLKSNSNKRRLKQKLLDSLTTRERRADPLVNKKYYRFLTSFFGF